MSVLDAPVGPPPLSKTPPGKELGAETSHVGGLGGWASFVDEQELVPELAWPSSIRTYHQMRGDSQVEALHIGTVQPVREFRWSIDPNSAPAALVEQVASDFGLPIRGHEDDDIARGPREFDFDAFLSDALLAPIYGHFYFEIVGATSGSKWNMSKLAPRHPRTLQEFQTTNTGDLLGIRQNIGGAGPLGWIRLPPPIPANKLVPVVWRPEAGSHVGRSLLRSLYREWLVKDRTIRVAAINVERAGGIPVIEGPMGASDDQIRDLAKMARSFKVAEGGGGAIPFGSKLNLVGGHVPDAIALLKYCDDCMARVWALMLVQLGMTSTGNRALGAEFAIYAARAQRSMAKWIKAAVDRFLDAYTEWNLGSSATHAPLLHYEQAKPDSMSVTDLVALLEAGALHVDPELESWLRAEHGLPPAPPAPSTPELGDLTPEEVALITNSRNPPALPAENAKPPVDPTQQSVEPTLARREVTDKRVLATISLPSRPLRRKPYEQEIRAAVDFASLDTAHSDAFTAIENLWRYQIIPAQIQAIGEQVVTTKAGTPRKVVTRTAMASLAAPVEGRDPLVDHLLQAAKSGALSALAELSAQGVAANMPTDDHLAGLVGDQADAVLATAANGLSLSAQGKASVLAGGGRSPEQLRGELEAYLSGLQHQWTLDRLQGAATMAQNAGRFDVFGSVQGTAQAAGVRYYASEILDLATCTECIAVDGTEYPDIQAAEQDYSSGGLNSCAGGPRCRGTVIAVYGEASPLSTPPGSEPDWSNVTVQEVI